ncbi:MAG: type II toxin-antitoxin system RelE/ParE family toxin [Chloroflexi bacterium]|nr:type II toxin-antitoxin system RelE/ParE family toxin [Chloroflexota bacterium]
MHTMAGDEWSIVSYVQESGRKPVQEFLEGLDARTQARLIDSIRKLKTLNVNASEPLVRHLEGKVWELREISAGNAYRVL